MFVLDSLLAASGLLQTLEWWLDKMIQRPIVMLALMACPPFIIAWLAHILPSKRALALVAMPAIMSIFLAFEFRSTLWALLFIDLAIFLVLAIDLFTVVRKRNFSVRRKVLRIASLGKLHDVELSVECHSSRNAAIDICDDFPDHFQVQPERFQANTQGRSRQFFEYKFKTNRRGKFDMNSVHIRTKSLLGFWNGHYQIPTHSEVDVYPDMKQIAEFDLLARTNRLSLVGVRRTRRVGTDNEFERLRDYNQDDNFRHIDWRSSARRRKLTVRDFQTSQSQRIIFMVDCGRMMTGKSGAINMLDHALNAMLMLSYVALRQGDSVGLLCFSDSIHNYVPPRNGVKHINRLLHGSFDQHPEYVESNYDAAFLHLRKHCRKRALVVLLTNVIDDINAMQIQNYLSAMTGKHLPMSVLLRDHNMFDPIEEYQASGGNIYEASAASEILLWRHQVISDLTHKGVLTLDVFPESLTSSLINQYLMIKARHLL